MMFDPNAIECDRCHGYGSSLAESSAKCTKCGGSGLHPVQPADVAEQHQAEQLRQLAQLRQLRQARPAPARLDQVPQHRTLAEAEAEARRCARATGKAHQVWRGLATGGASACFTVTLATRTFPACSAMSRVLQVQP